MVGSLPVLDRAGQSKIPVRTIMSSYGSSDSALTDRTQVLQNYSARTSTRCNHFHLEWSGKVPRIQKQTLARETRKARETHSTRSPRPPPPLMTGGGGGRGGASAQHLSQDSRRRRRRRSDLLPLRLAHLEAPYGAYARRHKLPPRPRPLVIARVKEVVRGGLLPIVGARQGPPPPAR